MTRGDQRDRDRARAQKRNNGKSENNKHTKKSTFNKEKDK